MRGIGEESIELGGIGETVHREAAHMRESGVRIKEVYETGDRFNLFKMFNYESSEHSVVGIAGATDIIIFVWER